MKTKRLLPFCSFVFLFSAPILTAQDKPAQSPATAPELFAYDLNREVTLVGTVVSYSSTSKTPPAGPRVLLQTPSGVVDIHLGDARLLAAHQFTIQQGDTLRVVGENTSFSGGTQFLARIVQNGSQVLLLRSYRGFPILPSAPRRLTTPGKQGSVL